MHATCRDKFVNSHMHIEIIDRINDHIALHGLNFEGSSPRGGTMT
jgi:hypothetical protein